MSNDQIRQLATVAWDGVPDVAYYGFVHSWMDGERAAQEFYPTINAAAHETVATEFPGPPHVQAPPLDNSNAGWGIGLGIFALVAGATSIASAPLMGVLVIIVGIVLLIGAKASWTSREEHERRTQELQRSTIERWKSDRASLLQSLEYSMQRGLHFDFARRLEIPDRLHTAFIDEALQHADLNRFQWRVDWWVAQPKFPPPPPVSSERLEHEEYEEYCAAWMRSLGWMSAQTTRYSRDGGIDVTTDQHVVQCKHYNGGSVGAREVREIFGVAAAEAKLAVVITSGRFTNEAVTFAGANRVALVHLDERHAQARALNDAARELMSQVTHTLENPTPPLQHELTSTSDELDDEDEDEYGDEDEETDQSPTSQDSGAEDTESGWDDAENEVPYVDEETWDADGDGDWRLGRVS